MDNDTSGSLTFGFMLGVAASIFLASLLTFCSDPEHEEVFGKAAIEEICPGKYKFEGDNLYCRVGDDWIKQ